MKLAIMQPYFFPYIGYFQLMNIVDTWVIFDDIQFIDKGWINRNRILHPDVKKEWQYITVPLKNRGQFDKICDISINADGKWQDQILGKLTSYKKRAPYYEQTISFVRECLQTNETNLSQFLVGTLRKTADALQIDTTFVVQSEMKLDFRAIEHPGQWALRISEQMGASEYINPHSGAEIFDEDEFKRACIKLRFVRPELGKYVQRSGGFVPGLSIIDVMMWNDPADIKKMIENEYEIVEKDMLKK